LRDPGTSAHARQVLDAARIGILTEISDLPAGTFLAVQRTHCPLELRTSTATRFAPSGTTTSAVRFEVLKEIEVSRQAGPGDAKIPDWHAKKATATKANKCFPKLENATWAENWNFTNF
jgi:hypothetical protein